MSTRETKADDCPSHESAQNSAALNSWTILALLFLTVLCSTDWVYAQDEDWRLRLGTVTAGSAITSELGEEFGGFLGVEYKLTERVGFELLVVDTDVVSEIDFEFGPFSSRVASTVDMRPILLAADFHLTPSRRADLFIGPTVGYAELGSVDVTSSGSGFDGVNLRVTEVENQVVFGARAGLDIKFRDRFMLTAGATYLRVPLDAVEADDDDERGNLDPVILNLGIGFRF